MKIFIALITLALSSFPSNAEDNAAERDVINSRAVATLQAIIIMTKHESPDDAHWEHLLVMEKGRHMATPQKLRSIFHDVDERALKVSRVDYFKDEGMVMVRLESPLRMDFEFKIQENNELRLKSMHP